MALSSGTFNFKISIDVREVGANAPKYDLKSDLGGEFTLKQLFEFTKNSLIIIARDTLAEEQQSGFDRKPVVLVDKKPGKRIEDVNPVGSIEFIKRQDAATFLPEIYTYIHEKSPVDTGTYFSNNIVFHNNKLVSRNRAGLEAYLKRDPDIKENDVFTFINIVPYARKLERFGISKGRSKTRLQRSKDKEQRSGRVVDSSGKKSILAPNGAYYLASRQAIRKYGKNARIAFGYTIGSKFGFPGVQNYSGKKFRTTFKQGLDRRKGKQNGPYLYPSISVKFTAGGTLDV